MPCQKIIVGSTQNPVQRWSTHKSTCNKNSSKSTGLSKHFTHGQGCPNDPGRQKETLNFVLIDHYDTTRVKLEAAKHEKGAKCRCQECSNLIRLRRQEYSKTGNFLWKFGAQYKR